ncbi:MAG: Mor transcription activator family protein [bacterium]
MDYLKYLELDDLNDEQKEIAKVIGIENYVTLMVNFGGNNIYVHKPERANITVRNRFIKNEFNDYNHKELTKKYNLTYNHLKRIINEN